MSSKAEVEWDQLVNALFELDEQYPVLSMEPPELPDPPKPPDPLTNILLGKPK